MMLLPDALSSVKRETRLRFLGGKASSRSRLPSWSLRLALPMLLVLLPVTVVVRRI